MRERISFPPETAPQTKILHLFSLPRARRGAIFEERLNGLVAAGGVSLTAPLKMPLTASQVQALLFHLP